ncbi:MAG: hypothetical protein ACR2IV_17020 [Bryobacteraceae bacterium]
MPAAELLSFLKQTRGPWTERDLAKALNLSSAEAKHSLSAMQLQGYIESAGQKWRTTEEGRTVSGAKTPRFNGRTRRSQNPYSEKVFHDCLAKWEEGAAHSILARSVSLQQRPYTLAQINLSLHFRCNKAADHTFQVAIPCRCPIACIG